MVLCSLLSDVFTLFPAIRNLFIHIYVYMLFQILYYFMCVWVCVSSDFEICVYPPLIHISIRIFFIRPPTVKQIYAEKFVFCSLLSGGDINSQSLFTFMDTRRRGFEGDIWFFTLKDVKMRCLEYVRVCITCDPLFCACIFPSLFFLHPVPLPNWRDTIQRKRQIKLLCCYTEGKGK